MKKYILMLLLTLSFNYAQAIVVNLEGVGQGQKFPIMVISQDPNATETEAINEIIRADLARSGLFEIIRLETTPNASQIPYVVQTFQHGETISAQLYNYTNQGDALNTFTATAEWTRELAHLLANQIFESITGIKGVFHTKIAYASGHQLILADADGENAQVLVQSTAPISSPAWSPRGDQIAYVDFVANKPNIYVYDLRTDEKHLVAQYPGNNSSPAWTSDGTMLAITWSGTTFANLYLINPKLDEQTPIPLHVNRAINTETTFLPQGKGLLFTSDRAGEPQIYRLTPNSKAFPKRITLKGKKNMNPAISHDGQQLAYSSLQKEHYLIAIQNMNGSDYQILTADNNISYFSPSFSPNDTQLIYTTSQGDLMISNTDGSFQTTLPSTHEVNSVAWGPM